MMKKIMTIIIMGSLFLLPLGNAEASSFYQEGFLQTKKHEHTSSYQQHHFGNKHGQSRFYWNGKTKKYVPSFQNRWNNNWTGKQNNDPVQKEDNPTINKENQTNQDSSVKEEQITKPNKGSENLSAFEQQVLELTNAEREKAGLQSLQIDENLTKSAQEKSKDMSVNQYFSHTSPSYGSPFDMMKLYGVSYRAAAENIARGQRTAEEVVRDWMNSPGHRQNILTANFTHIGIGYEANGNYWTQQFIQK